MSLLCLTLLITSNVALAAVGSNPDLEAALMAKLSMTPRPVDDVEMSPPAIDNDSEEEEATTQGSVAAETPSLEAAVLAKYNVQTLDELESAILAKSKQGSSLNVRKLEDAAQQEAQPQMQTEVADMQGLEAAGSAKDNAQEAADGSQQSGLNVRRADDVNVPTETQGQSLANAMWAEVAQAEAPAEVADLAGLEAAGHATDNAAQSTGSQQGSGLNVRKADDVSVPTETQGQSLADAMWAEVAQSTGSQQGSGLNVRKVEDVVAPQAQAPTEVADLAGLEAATHANENFEKMQSSSEEAQRSKLSFKRPSGDTTPEEVNTPEVSSPTQEASASKSKKVSMVHDMPHYRNHGAAMAHVEPTARKARTPEQEAAFEAAEKAAKAALDARRAEVEDVFHISKAGDANKPVDQDAPAGAGSKLLRFVLFLGAVISVGVICYQKFSVISQLYEGRTGPLKFKAKQEDMDGFPPAPRYAPQGGPGFLMSAMDSGRNGLARRSAMDNHEFGV